VTGRGGVIRFPTNPEPKPPSAQTSLAGRECPRGESPEVGSFRFRRGGVSGRRRVRVAPFPAASLAGHVVFGEHSLLATVSGQKFFVVKRLNSVPEPVVV
ncbi:hypothetical protein E2320_000104, partial [Naja naja]